MLSPTLKSVVWHDNFSIEFGAKQSYFKIKQVKGIENKL